MTVNSYIISSVKKHQTLDGGSSRSRYHHVISSGGDQNRCIAGASCTAGIEKSRCRPFVGACRNAYRHSTLVGAGINGRKCCPQGSVICGTYRACGGSYNNLLCRRLL